jgi:hypothetical protein
MITRRILVASLLLAGSLTPTLALGQTSDTDKATARDLTIEGYKSLESKDYAGALDRFTRADTLFHAPSVILGMARAQVGLGKLVSAQELYNRAAHETLPANASGASKKAVQDAQRELDALSPRIPSVIIKVKGSDAPRVTFDGTEVRSAALGVKRPADPGAHVIRAEAPGLPARELKLTLVEGKAETVTLDMAPELPTPAVIPPAPPPIEKPAPAAIAPLPAAPVTPPPAAPLPPRAELPIAAPQPPPQAPSSHTPSYVLFGAAGAGVVLGAVFAGMGFSAKSGYDKVPTVAGADTIDRDALIADICFGSAVLLGTAGFVLLLRKEPPPTAAGLFLAPRVGTTGAAMAAGFRF